MVNLQGDNLADHLDIGDQNSEQSEIVNMDWQWESLLNYGQINH